METGVTLFLEDNFRMGPCSFIAIPEKIGGRAARQYGFFFLLSNIHFDIFALRNGPSVTMQRIFEFVHCPINLRFVLN